MDKKNGKSPGFTFCICIGTCLGMVLGAAMDKLAVGMALGYMFGVMYYLFFAKSDKEESNNDTQLKE